MSAISGGMMAAFELSGSRGFGKRRFKIRGGDRSGVKGLVLGSPDARTPSWGHTLAPRVTEKGTYLTA